MLKWLNPFWWLFLLLAAAVVALIVASFPLFVFPEQDRPGKADAVVVLAGGKDRLPKALRLMGEGVARTLVIDRNRPKAPDLERAVCAGRYPFRVLCIEAEPYSTRGEAEAVARLAARRGWRSIVVVTSTYHVTRARLIFHRCLPATRVVASKPPLLSVPLDVLSEWLKLAYAETLKRGC